jgi:hypothetical protein
VLQTIVDDSFDRYRRQKVDIFGEHCNFSLKDKPLRLRTWNTRPYSNMQNDPLQQING